MEHGSVLFVCNDFSCPGYFEVGLFMFRDWHATRQNLQHLYSFFVECYEVAIRLSVVGATVFQFTFIVSL